MILVGTASIIYIFIKLKFRNFRVLLGDLSVGVMAYAAALRALEASGYVPSLRDWRNTINFFTAMAVILVCWFGLRYGRWSRFAKED
ncbi:MAG: hypothetical protein KatS3mg019_1969 [Fimbriimonadales bacterium]|nr:MAG: hypothetical protein KatS3mg019_1969 [Fimbriimonadales bacterium]